MSPTGRPRQNNGPCVVCGLQDGNETFRRLKDWSLEKANKCSHTLSSIKLEIGAQLCIKHYNELVVYDRNETRSNKKRNNDTNDTAYNAGGNKKRVYLSQETYEQLNNVINNEKLEQEVLELREKVNSLMRKSQNDGT